MLRTREILRSIARNHGNVAIAKQVPEPLRNPQLPPRKLFINNEWVDSTSGEWIKTINPTNGEIITEIPKASREDVDRAVAAARAAFHRDSQWRTMPARKRGELMLKLTQLMERDRVLLASLDSLDVGKVYNATYKSDISWAIQYVKHYAGWADKNNGQTVQVDNDHVVYTVHEPTGVAGLICAWNFPIVMLCFKLGCSLAAGCTSVVKASQHSSLSTLHMAELIKEAGFPNGVVNVVTGSGDVGSMLTEHPDVDVVSFTGSTPVGLEVYKKGASTMKRMILELGGKSPNIILKDADIDKAVEHAHFAVFQNMGQCCCAGARTFVHESIYKEFVEKSKRKIQSKVIGDPFDPSVNHGPQATEDQLNTVLNYIELGKKDGAKLEVGGNRVNRSGYFVEPTMFSETSDDMTICQEEIFGPVQIITPYSTINEVIDRANDSEYGLASAVFGNNVSDIMKITEGMRAGTVWVNCYFQIQPHAPFGGFKMSGLGREGGTYGLNAFSEVKSVYIKKNV